MNNLLARVPPSSDFACWQQIFREKEYEPVIDLVKDKFAPLKILDLGANVGYASAYFKQEFPNAEIISVELDRDNYKLLEKNVDGLATPIFGGIWSKNCQLIVKKDFRDGRNWAYYAVEDEEGDIPGIALGEILNEPIDILKVDIEGGEVELFKDDSFLELVNIIAIEIHDEYKCRPKILSSLMKYNFEFQNYGDVTIGRKEPR